jgi:uncharacterized 2Fe-2S/4Fe-4S cluster protein (DUF4445 family)
VSCTVQFEPSGTAIEIEPGRTLLEAARAAGISLGAACGGRGTCGKCQVRILSGPLPPLGDAETRLLSENAARQGWRLACRYIVTASVTAETLLVRTFAKDQMPPRERPFAVAPPVRRWQVAVPASTLEKPGDDLGNLASALEQAGAPKVDRVDLSVARRVPDLLRNAGGNVSASVRGGELIGARPAAGTSGARECARGPLGLAVDLGTTNLAAYLYRMDDGSLLGICGASNPLSSYGADIVSRLGYGAQSPEKADELQRVLAKAVNLLAEHAARELGCTHEDIEEMVVVGNSGMHHLFLDLPGRQLIRAPFVPAVRAALSVKARELGIAIAGGAYAYMPPLVGGFVGSDLLAVALSTRMDRRPGVRLALDIGTNTELLLSVDGALHCCSTASGPALEGAALKFGTVALPGAIDRVWLDTPDGAPSWSTVGNRPPTGICGSGIIDALSCLHRQGVIAGNGRLRADGQRVLPDPDGDHRYVLAPAGSTALGVDLTISQTEIRALQLAKGAIRAGIDTLLSLHGLDVASLDEIVIAGTFGNHLHVESAVEIGLFPRVPRERFRQVGNAAGVGAVMMLLSDEERRSAEELSRSITHVELAQQKGFRRRFALAQWFPEESP